MTAWNQNDDLFFSELKEGYAWQQLPALFFVLQGLPVRMPALTVRESIRDAGEWLSSEDLIVNDHVLEVKSRNERFVSPGTFPFDTVFVDTVTGFESKETKPLAYIMVSRKTGAMLWLYTDNSLWSKLSRFDRVRKIQENFYAAPRELLRPLDSLIGLLK
jgi:hypothetical protein